MKNTEIKKSSNYLWTIIAILVLAILLAVSYKLKSFLKPSVIATAELDKSCDLRKGACSSKLPAGGKLTFSIDPNNIPILRPLQLKVEIEGVDASKVDVDFKSFFGQGTIIRDGMDFMDEKMGGYLNMVIKT